MKIVILLVLAICNSSAVVSRICETEPTDELMSGSCIVWMESITTNSGCASSMACLICFISVSGNSKKSESPRTPNLSARNFICDALSSPAIYKIFLPRLANCPEICSNKVDLPIPGSPPINTMEPGTIPPPRTRLNSSLSVLMRGVSSMLTSSKRSTFAT